MLKGWFRKIANLLTGRRAVDEALFEELEELLILSDVSVHTAGRLIQDLRQAAQKAQAADAEHVRALLQEQLIALFSQRYAPLKTEAPTPPLVYLIVGVNGTGKTTTIAKLAARFKKKGKEVLLAAADTFRAAAIDQLQVWGQRVRVPVIAHQPGGDPGAVVFDALQAARARGVDVVIADTAGRLHTKHNLMEELRKIERVVTRELQREPDEALLVLDATTGQNALVQTQHFAQALHLTGISLSKLDGTARGGTLITIAEEVGLPIKLLGVGEGLKDLIDFEPRHFVEMLLSDGA